MIAYIRNLFDRRTLDQKIADGIAKQVGGYKRNRFRLNLSHTVFPTMNNRVRIADYKPEERRLFH